MSLFSILLLALALLVVPASAQTPETGHYREGLQAFEAGDYQTAMAVWLRLTGQRDADAAYGIGLMYEHGLGIEANLQAALEWYRYAADAGSPEAYRRLVHGPEDLPPRP